HLSERGYKVCGMDRWPSCGCGGVDYHEGDILNTAALAQLFMSIKPDMIFHLAGVSFPGDADKSPQYALSINMMGAVSVLDAAFQSCASSKILLVGSSKQYSDAVADSPVGEETPCRPTSFYGISKYAAELVGMQYVRQHGMDVRFTRSFNHTGPGQSDRFVCSDWAKQAAGIALGRADSTMRVGDTGPAIDFTDVRDVVRAYLLILEKGARGEVYNVCSGSAVSLQEVLAAIVEKSGKKIDIVQDQARLRAHRTGRKTAGDRTKLTRATGWVPEIPLSKTLDDLYRHWRSSLSKPAA
ncbi:MAG: GDP-mannose 4,6-dehydratase, partial [Chitinispirillaceae bacterium]|nr:GDP-mannose 4,6-dehydratase [Chitinispirillaceae bacterium]